MSQGGSHSDFDNEIKRASGQYPEAERSQWWIGPVVLLGVVVVAFAVVTIVLLVRGDL